MWASKYLEFYGGFVDDQQISNFLNIYSDHFKFIDSSFECVLLDIESQLYLYPKLHIITYDKIKVKKNKQHSFSTSTHYPQKLMSLPCSHHIVTIYEEI